MGSSLQTPIKLAAEMLASDINQPLHSRYNWLKKPLPSAKFRHWLIDSCSLTARLKVLYPDFAVRSVSIKFAKAFTDESVLLSLKANQHALIREVLLMGNNQPVVFAHSVLPRASLRGAWNGLGKLGNKPLGATLFANQIVKRTALSYKKLSPHHKLFKRATAHLSVKPTHLWARRSVFTLNCAKILVTEVFLEQLFK